MSWRSTVVSRVSLKGFVEPCSTKGAPFTFASKTGWVVISTCEGMFERNGMPIRTSRTVWTFPFGRSSKSTLPPSTRMLFTAKRARDSFSSGFFAPAFASRRSEML